MIGAFSRSAGHLAHRDAVRQRDEEDVARLQLVDRDEFRSVRLRRFGWSARTNLPALRSRRDLLQLRFRMIEQEAHCLAARIPGSADDRYPNHDPLSVPSNASTGRRGRIAMRPYLCRDRSPARRSRCGRADFDDVIDDPGRDVDAGGVDAVAELHRVVDFVHQEARSRSRTGRSRPRRRRPPAPPAARARRSRA